MAERASDPFSGPPPISAPQADFSYFSINAIATEPENGMSFEEEELKRQSQLIRQEEQKKEEARRKQMEEEEIKKQREMLGPIGDIWAPSFNTDSSFFSTPSEMIDRGLVPTEPTLPLRDPISMTASPVQESRYSATPPQLRPLASALDGIISYQKQLQELQEQQLQQQQQLLQQQQQQQQQLLLQHQQQQQQQKQQQRLWSGQPSQWGGRAITASYSHVTTSCQPNFSRDPFKTARNPSPEAMASTGSPSGDTSSGGCTTPNSNPNYDSDGKSDCVEDHQIHDELYHHCYVCKQPYADPRVLDCLHSYCMYCLKSMLVMNGDLPSEIICTICKVSTKLETGHLTVDTAADYGRRRYIENLTFNEDDNLLCRFCKQGNPAVARCYECAHFLCNMCSLQHGKMRSYTDHKVSLLTGVFQRPSPPDLNSCGAHPDQKHATSIYCYMCRKSFCDAAQHHFQFPTHKMTNIADSTSFQEMICNVGIQNNNAQGYLHFYLAGLERMALCEKNFLEDLENNKAQAIAAIEQKSQDLAQGIMAFTRHNRNQVMELIKQYHNFDKQLKSLRDFMEAQCKYAEPWDNLQTKPFVEKILQATNNSKPEPCNGISFDFEFMAGSAADLAQMLGTVRLTAQPNQLTSGNQQPIARPTAMNRPTVNQNYTTNDAYQMGGYNVGTNNMRQFSPIGQGQAYRTSSSGQSTETGYIGGESRSQSRGSFDPFPGQPYQRSSPSPMTLSQPNSASMVSDSVFDFNNLHVDRADGTNANFTNNGFSSTQNQNRSYQTWSNGVDRPGSAGSPAQLDDIFTRSSMFQVPEGSGSSSSRSSSGVRRTRMQFVTKFGEYGNSHGQFTEPSGVAIDSENRLIVADTNNSRIQIFNIHGHFLSQFGSTLNTRLTYPNRIAVSKVTGKVVITERAPSHRVQTYTINGDHLKTFGEDILQHPRGVAVDRNDNIIIIECKVMRVTIFSMEGQLLDQFSLSRDLQFPNSVAVNNRQEIFISDNRSHNVKVFSYKGELLRTIGQEGLTNYPIAVAINQRDQVVVADNHNNFNITVFEQDGTFVGGYESKTKHAQCFDLTVTDDGLAILTSKDFKVYCYPYQEDSPHHPQNQRR